MITIKDYAKETGVSYEAVRQRIKRYEAELEGHIHRQGRTQYLDDVAVAFLNEHRLQDPIVLYDKGAGEDFRALQAELQEAKDLANEYKDMAKDYWEQMKKKDATVSLLAEENRELRIQAASVPHLEADNEAARVRTQEAVESAQKAQCELEAALKKTAVEQAEKEAWKKYAADLEAYSSQKWWKRRKADRPVAPVFQEDKE